jgi:general secretion pathway protein I
MWNSICRGEKSFAPRKSFAPAKPVETDAGFTLLEVMVAVAIMAIVLVAVFRLHAQTIAMSGAARFYTTAPFLAEDALARMEFTAANQLGGDSGEFGDAFPGFTWRAEVETVESEYLGQVAEDLKRIDLTVVYEPEGLSYPIRTYRMIYEE